MKAVELSPRNAKIWNTLGLAQYRARDWNAAIAAFAKSMQLSDGGSSYDYFFLAKAHWQLGHKDEARTWYDRAVQWMNTNAAKDEELLRLRADADERFGISQTQPATDSATGSGVRNP